MDKETIEKYRKAGEIAREVREWSKNLIEEGKKTLEIAEEIENKIKDKGAGWAFPTNISINEEAAHSTPRIDDNSVIKKGDLVTVDLGVHYKGYIADTATTVEVGTSNHQDLIGASRNGLNAALDKIGPGIKTSEVGAVIEEKIKEKGFSPIINLSGHQLKEYELHGGLRIPNLDNGSNKKVKEGMALAIEPFATSGVGKVKEGEESQIYKLKEDKPVRNKSGRKILKWATERKELPFCKRWLKKEVKFGIEIGIKSLEKKGAIKNFPVLKERSGAKVSQAEDTVLVLEDGNVITTQ